MGPTFWSVVLGLPVLALHVYYMSYQTYVYVRDATVMQCDDCSAALTASPYAFCVKSCVRGVRGGDHRLRLDRVLNAIGIAVDIAEMLLSLVACVRFYRFSQL